jgi:hypothetical protein
LLVEFSVGEAACDPDHLDPAPYPSIEMLKL